VAPFTYEASRLTRSVIAAAISSGIAGRSVVAAGALGRKTLRGRKSDPAGAAGDERNSAVEAAQSCLDPSETSTNRPAGDPLVE